MKITLKSPRLLNSLNDKSYYEITVLMIIIISSHVTTDMAEKFGLGCVNSPPRPRGGIKLPMTNFLTTSVLNWHFWSSFPYRLSSPWRYQSRSARSRASRRSSSCWSQSGRDCWHRAAGRRAHLTITFIRVFTLKGTIMAKLNLDCLWCGGGTWLAARLSLF